MATQGTEPQLWASWVDIPKGCPFSLANIPFGIISTKADPTHRPAVAIGKYALDLKAFTQGDGFSAMGSFTENLRSAFSISALNPFAALGRPVHGAVRDYLIEVFRQHTKNPGTLRDNASLRNKAMIPLDEVEMHLPLDIGDYTDFYAGRNHAHNVGVLFRGAANALQPNYTHLPVAYHGRASSVVVSGTPIRRPWGQILENPQAEVKIPKLMPCKKMDLELELAAFICKDSVLGEPIPVDSAEEYIFGYALMIDWSARDIQAWEYVPLGPFTSKNMGTSISPWVVLADALYPFRTEGLQNTTELLSYLREGRPYGTLGIELEVDLITPKGSKETITKTNAKNLLWSWPQMVAHHTITGCNLRTGDLFGSGTISGTEPGSEGSLLEMSQNGKIPLKISGGEERKFLEDGDTLVVRGWAGEGDQMVGFGECVGRIEPALPLFK